MSGFFQALVQVHILFFRLIKIFGFFSSLLLILLIYYGLLERDYKNFWTFIIVSFDLHLLDQYSCFYTYLPPRWGFVQQFHNYINHCNSITVWNNNQGYFGTSNLGIQFLFFRMFFWQILIDFNYYYLFYVFQGMIWTYPEGFLYPLLWNYCSYYCWFMWCL